MERIVVNVVTGEQRVIPFTAEEIAAIKAQPTPEPLASLPPMTAAERLKAAGFSIDELRALLLGDDQ
jgi:hypothetical protein